MSMWESNTWGSVGQTPSMYRYHEPTTSQPIGDPPAMPEPWPVPDDDEECDEEYDDDWWREIDDDDDEDEY